jgi:outer membrane receptor protein involved in Fe transport
MPCLRALYSPILPRLPILLLAVVACARAADDEPGTPTVLPSVEVIGTTPLPGIGLPIEQVPGNVQTATDAAIDRTNARDVTELLNREFGGVHLNDVQGNPFQPDVNYRGYTASPLLGTPQGLSMYMDGVRLNQPFGDVVSWDLIPRGAISSITLIPGSNPLFGLNTLGGALSIQTKDGTTYPGTRVEASYGTFGRRSAELQHGGSNALGLNWFFLGNYIREHGWRDDSPSRLGQIFSKIGWHDAMTDVKLTYAYADTKLQGSGLQEQRFLERDYSSVYTKPDITQNKSHFFNLGATRNLSDAVLFSGNAYYRRIKAATLNGDLNDESLDQAVYQPNAAERAALTAAGFTGFPLAGENASNTPFPFWRCIANVLRNDEPAEKCNGLVNRTHADQSNFGVSGQLTLQSRLVGLPNQFTGGAAYDQGSVRFSQASELGFLNPDRSITGLGAFADGVTGGTIEGAPFDNRVDLKSRIRTWSLFATDTLSIAGVWHLTLSGRYNSTKIQNRDRINPGGGDDSLDGDHRYSRFNPAAGLTYAPSRAIVAYISYNEGSRAPTAIELGCANAAQPCRLPNSMAGDPPLDQVVTRTWEAGLRGAYGRTGKWALTAFRAENADDILFVAAPASPQSGFFRNFGKTRRDGIEVSLARSFGSVSVGANYTYLDATFRSFETVPGASNSTNSVAAADPANRGVEGGTIQIRSGNRIPLIPQHILKAHVDWKATPMLSFDVNAIAVGSSYARGNENNAQQPDGVLYLGSGKSGGYAVLNLGSQYRVDPQFVLFAQVYNLFDRQYSTASLLGPTGFTASGNFIARPFANADAVQHATFYAPGTPRTAWIGFRYSFERERQAGRSPIDRM